MRRNLVHAVLCPCNVLEGKDSKNKYMKKFGNGEDFNPRNERWNFRNKKIVQPTRIE